MTRSLTRDTVDFVSALAIWSSSACKAKARSVFTALDPSLWLNPAIKNTSISIQNFEPHFVSQEKFPLFGESPWTH
jgi:hypothetical protein